MTALDLGAWFAQAAGGSMLLALPVAVLAGVVSFFSPCVLPLLPGYLSYATGLTASDVTSGTGSRGRMLLGTSLFIAGFALVFVSTGALFGGLGSLLLTWSRPISVAIGIVAIVLGLVFAGVIRLGQGTYRVGRAPAVGLAAVPAVCRLLLRRSERCAARLLDEEPPPHLPHVPLGGHRQRPGTGSHRGGRHHDRSTQVG